MVCKVYCQVEAVQDITGVPETGYNPFFFSSSGDTLLFKFTDQSFTRVLSALINGAYLTYGAEGRQVIWDFLVNVEFPLPICEQIIDCIENDSDTQEALANFIATNPLAKAAIQGLIDNGSVVVNPTGIIGQTDNLDNLFGACTFIIDTMNGLNEDLYEALEASTNKREEGQITFRAIPLLNELPFDEVSEFIDFLANSVAENYASEYTTTPLTGMRDRLRCGLFCLAQANDNTLTWDIIAHYFWSLVGYDNDYIQAFRDFVTFINSGSWPGEEIVYVSFANIASALSSASKFAEMTLPSLSSLIKLGLNDPDPDWVTLCDECSLPYTYRWEMSESDGGWLPNGANQGLYSDGAWNLEAFYAPVTYYVGAQIKQTIPTDSGLTTIKIYTEDVVLGTNSGGAFAFANASLVTAPTPQTTVAGAYVYTFTDLDDDDDEIIVIVRAGANSAPPGGSGKITRIEAIGIASGSLPAFTGGEFV